MALIEFVQNYEDLSTDRGFQFKFHCDRCSNGFMTSFQPSLLGTAGSLLRAAGDLFGGFARSAGNSAFEVQRMVGGSAHDEALQAAVAEAKPSFHQCPRCAKWTCSHPCWNAQAGLCAYCAPNFQAEFAAAHAHAQVDAARAQLNDRAHGTDFVAGVPMGAGVVAQALPYSGAPPLQAPPPGRDPAMLPTGAGVPDAPVAAQARGEATCAGCGTRASSKFCPDCGKPMPAPVVACGACGHRPSQPTRFCGGCGAKMG